MAAGRGGGIDGWAIDAVAGQDSDDGQGRRQRLGEVAPGGRVRRRWRRWGERWRWCSVGKWKEVATAVWAYMVSMQSVEEAAAGRSRNGLGGF
jgi:hypothetical protein